MKLDLRALARDLAYRLIHKLSDTADVQTGQAVEKTECRSYPTTKGCQDHVSEAEYQRLVELGHWHHRRQRRRNRRL